MKRNKNKINEDASPGASTAGGIASVPTSLNNLLQRRLPEVSEIITNIYKKKRK